MTANFKNQLQIHLREVVRDRDPYLASLGHFYVQQYIRQQMQPWGTVEFDEFEVGGQTHLNLILNLPPLSPPLGKGGKEGTLDLSSLGKGGKHPLPPILIGAHYVT